MLVAALKGGLIDGAVVSGKNQDKPVLPIPVLATTLEEITESAGTNIPVFCALALPGSHKAEKD